MHIGFFMSVSKIIYIFVYNYKDVTLKDFKEEMNKNIPVKNSYQKKIG